MADIFQCKCGSDDFIRPLQFTDDCKLFDVFTPRIMCLKCKTIYHEEDEFTYDYDKKEPCMGLRFREDGKDGW